MLDIYFIELYCLHKSQFVYNIGRLKIPIIMKRMKKIDYDDADGKRNGAAGVCQNERNGICAWLEKHERIFSESILARP